MYSDLPLIHNGLLELKEGGDLEEGGLDLEMGGEDGLEKYS